MNSSPKTDDALDQEIMTLAEIAKYLKVSEKTILRMVKKGELPGSKVSNQWCFQRVAIEQWLTAKMESAPEDNLVSVIRTTPKIIPLAQLVSQDRIIMDVKAGDKESIIRQLTKPLEQANLLENPEEFIASLLAREEMGSTAIGYGVAIPHVHEQENSGVKQTCVVLGICHNGVDFDAMDGEPTYIFMLLCGNSITVHIRLLAKTMLMLRNPGTVEALRSCTTKSQVAEILRKADFNLAIRF
jgi:PTS system nitrogen regulatory IIA component